MKIVIFTSKNHFYANEVLKFLIRNFPDQIKLIIESEALIPGRSKFAGLIKYEKISGFNYVFSQVLKQYIFQFLSLISHGLRKDNFYFSYKKIYKNKIESWEKLAQVGRLIPVVEKEEPDLIISIYSKYILKKEMLHLAKLAVNLHPSLLPDYRGISPVFWALGNQEKKTGVTLHQMSEQIDAGRIISQQEIMIAEKETEHSLYLKCSQAGSRLLKEFILESGPADFKEKGEKGRYFSLPTRESVRNFKKDGRKFFTLRELMSIF